jgi:hypothetical protein
MKKIGLTSLATILSLIIYSGYAHSSMDGIVERTVFSKVIQLQTGQSPTNLEVSLPENPVTNIASLGKSLYYDVWDRNLSRLANLVDSSQEHELKDDEYIREVHFDLEGVNYSCYGNLTYVLPLKNIVDANVYTCSPQNEKLDSRNSVRIVISVKADELK